MAKPFGELGDSAFPDDDVEYNHRSHYDALHQLYPIAADTARDNPGFERSDDKGPKKRADDGPLAASD
jgi:hypothetical protein